MKRTPEQNRQLHTLLAKLHLMHQKASLAWSYSNGRTNSTSELSQSECDKLIAYLNAKVNPGINSMSSARYKQPTVQDEATKKLIRKIYSLAHELRWEKPDGSVNPITLHHWVETKGKHKKPMRDHSNRELADLIFQLEQILKKGYEKNKN